MKTCILFFFSCFYFVAKAQTIYSDGFETNANWTIFEEIVAGNPCYVSGIGEVLINNTRVYSGINALRVWSNKQRTIKSNHVIAAHHISNTSGITGKLRYNLWVYAPSDLGLTQTGPEFSIQSTRNVNGTNYTYIAGVQYVGNQWITDSKWNIWHNGQWVAIKFSEFDVKLSTDTWYQLKLEVDMTTNKYLNLSIIGNNINRNIDLTRAFQNATTGFAIGAETRSWTPSHFITLEGQNLWTNCTEIKEQTLYYDDVSLEQIQAPVYVCPCQKQK